MLIKLPVPIAIIPVSRSPDISDLIAPHISFLEICIHGEITDKPVLATSQRFILIPLHKYQRLYVNERNFWSPKSH